MFSRFRTVITGGLIFSLLAVLAAANPTVSHSTAARTALVPGQGVTLAVNATGTGAISYQWFRRGQPVGGATSSTLAITNATIADSGWYVVDATDNAGTTRSPPMFVLVAPPISRIRSWGDSSLFFPNGLYGPTDFVAIDTKFDDGLAITAAGGIVGWGATYNLYGYPGGLVDVVAVAVGGHHSVALNSDGTVTVWGDGSAGQLDVPPGLGNVVAISAGSYQTLALKSDGTVVAWGSPANGVTTIPSGLAGVTAIAAGDGHALALKADGTVVAWGYNFDGQCDVPSGLAGVIAVAVGDAHSLALKSDGTVVAWGRNSKGATNVPAGLTNVTRIAAGSENSVALKSNGTVVAWGSNVYGESTAFPNLGPVHAVAAGSYVSYALDDGSTPIVSPNISSQPSSTVLVTGQSATFRVQATGTSLTYRWLIYSGGQWQYLEGDNGGPYTGVQTNTLTISGNPIGGPTMYFCIVKNNLGSVSTVSVTLTPVTTPSGVVQLSAGSNTSFWVTSDGKLWSLSGNTTPTLIATDVVRSFAGYNHNFFLKSDRTLWAFGSNTYGALGDGTTTTRTTPVQVAANVVSFAGGFMHSAIVKTDGSLWCVGYNGAGQLGDGTTTDRYNFVQVVPSGVIGVTTRNNTTFFTKTDGTLWGMGSNYEGQLGTGTGATTMSPVQLAAKVSQISTGLNHALQLRSDGSLWAAGSNAAGALADGTTGSRLSFIPVAAGVRDVSAGYQHTLYITNDGSLWSAGSSGSGERGYNPNLGYLPINQIDTGVVAAAAGYSRSFFLKSDGRLWGTGTNPLGDTVQFSRNAPVVVSGPGAALPAAVSQVDANVSEPGRIILTWLPAIGAASYEVWRSAPGQPTPVTLVGETTDAIFSDLTATTGSNYSYAIKSKNLAGVPGFSPVIQAQATPLAPVVLQQPAAVMPRIGSTVRISVAVAANPGATFQWQVRPPAGSWGNVTDDATYQGALTDTLDVRGVSLVHDKMEFRCVATNTQGSVISNPATVYVDRAIAALSVGTEYAMLMRNDSTLWVIGAGPFYAMGEMVDGASRPRPTGLEVIGIAAGSYHALFIAPDHTLWAVGDNSNGQLGDGGTTYRSQPVQVATDVVAVAAGRRHSLFIKSDGTLWGMGSNSFGELGDGTPTQRNSPIQIATGVASASAGSFFSVFIKSDNTLWSMGRNYSGNLGDGSTTHRNSPVFVANGVLSASAGDDHSLFVKTDQTLWGMGNNGYGQLGFSPFVASSYVSPVQIVAGATAASAGTNHSLFRKTDGTLWGMGLTVNGELGLGATTVTYVPLQIATGVSQLGAGPNASFLVREDGSLWAMGRNLNRDLGDGTASERRVPVLIAGGDLPVFTVQPIGGTVFVQGNFGLSVTAQSAMPLTYQWRKGGVPIAGATGSTYTVTGAGFADAGSYDVVVSNAAGSTVSGSVNLTVAGNLASWSQTKFTAGELLDVNISGPNADPDGDGLPNLLEYALGFEPKSVTASGLPAASVSGPDWIYTYTRPSDRADVNYAVECSTTLSSWSPAGVTHELVSSSGGTETWQAKYPVASAPNCYFRLKVTQ